MARRRDNPNHHTALCTYRVKATHTREFRALLEKHWPTLLRLGLVTPEPSQVYEAEDENGLPYFVEIFTWISAKAPDDAHRNSEVMAIWEPMGELTEERGEKPAMEFPHMRRLSMSFSKS